MTFWLIFGWAVIIGGLYELTGSVLLSVGGWVGAVVVWYLWQTRDEGEFGGL